MRDNIKRIQVLFKSETGDYIERMNFSELEKLWGTLPIPENRVNRIVFAQIDNKNNTVYLDEYTGTVWALQNIHGTYGFPSKLV